MSANKTDNEYALAAGREMYADIPKAVWAAIAVSALTIGGDALDEAATRVITEWDALHTAGIVPQPVPGKYKVLVNREVGL